MTSDPALLPLVDLKARLDDIPVDVVEWESVGSHGRCWRIDCDNNTASALAYVLGHVDGIKNSISYVLQIRKSEDAVKAERIKGFFGTIGLSLTFMGEYARHQKRERELLEANNRYLEDARAARRELAALKPEAVTQTVTVKFDASLADRVSKISNSARLQRMEGLRSTEGLRRRPAPVTAQALKDILATMDSIDRHEILEAGYDMPDGSWSHFQENPSRRFIECNDECREAIVRVINNRRKAADGA